MYNVQTVFNDGYEEYDEVENLQNALRVVSLRSHGDDITEVHITIVEPENPTITAENGGLAMSFKEA